MPAASDAGGIDDPDASGADASAADAARADVSGTDDDAARPRQRVERVRGGRRAKLTPAPGSDPSPEAPAHRAQAAKGPTSPDDERITRERPPHW